jgi:nitrate reductase gamma subunit
MKRLAYSIVAAPVGFALMLTIGSSSVQAAVQIAADTPEIDAGSAASALTLLIGGALLLRDRLRLK